MAAHGYTQRSRGNLEMGLQMWMPQCRAVQTGTSPSPRCPQGAGAVPTGMVAILSVHRAAHCCLVQNTLLLIVRRVVQLLSPVRLFETPWTVAHQASLSLTISWSLSKFMSIESVMLSNYPILCCPFLLLPSVFPSISVFSSESAVHIRWPKYWRFSFSISPFSEYSGLISLQSKGLSES